VVSGELGKKPHVYYRVSLRDAAGGLARWMVPAVVLMWPGGSPPAEIMPAGPQAEQGVVDPKPDPGSVVFVPRTDPWSSAVKWDYADAPYSISAPGQELPGQTQKPTGYEVYRSTGQIIDWNALTTEPSLGDLESFWNQGPEVSGQSGLIDPGATEQILLSQTTDNFTTQATAVPSWMTHSVSAADQISYFAAAYGLNDAETSQLKDVTGQLSDTFPALSSNDTTVELLAYLGASLRGSPAINTGDWLGYFSSPPTATRPTPFGRALDQSAARVAELLKPRVTAPKPTPVTDIGIEIKVGNVDVQVSAKAAVVLTPLAPAVAGRIKKLKKSRSRKRPA